MKLKVFLSTVLFFVVILTPAYGNNDVPATVKVTLTSGFPTPALKRTVERNCSELLTMLNVAYARRDQLLSVNSAIMTDRGSESLNFTWSATQFYCTAPAISDVLIKTTSGYQLRNIPVYANEEDNEIGIDLDSRGNISEVFFAVPMHQYKNLMAGKNEVVDQTRREILLNFLEGVRTAYMRKDINYIENIYSDKALIIVGRQVQKTDQNLMPLRDNSGKEVFYKPAPEGTEYKRMTKQEYIESLRNVFKRNKSIRLKFSDIEIAQNRKAGYESYYGVTLIQDWNSDTYSDSGLLFFLIEFRGNQPPLIWVRSWQDASTTSRSDAINMGDFKIPRPDSLK